MAKWNIKPDEASEVLEDLLKIGTSPVAVKFVEKLDNWPPPGFVTPSGMGHKMAFCQVVSAARRLDQQFALSAKDIMCGAALLSFGWADLGSSQNRKDEIIHFFLEAGYAKDRETVLKILDSLPLLSGETNLPYKGLLIAPLKTGIIEDPDVVLIYGDSTQIGRLNQSVVYMTGETIKSEAQIGLSCTNYMIRPMLENKPFFVLPGRGEKLVAMVGNDEVCFAIPAGKLDMLITGLKTTAEKGVKLYPQFLFFEPKLGPTQMEFAEKVMAQVEDD